LDYIQLKKIQTLKPPKTSNVHVEGKNIKPMTITKFDDLLESLIVA
jgi:hypothetical protein